MLHFEHLQSLRAAETCIREYAKLFEHYPCVFGSDLFIIYYEHFHFFWIDMLIQNLLMLAVLKADHDSELSSFAFLGCDRYSAVHQFHYILCDRHAQAGAAVFAATTAVFLCKGIEYLRQE